MPDELPRKAPTVLSGRSRHLLLALIGAQLGVAVVLGFQAQRFAGVPDWPEPGVLLATAAGLMLAGYLQVDYHYRGQRDCIDMFEAVLTLALFVLTPVPAIAVAAAGKAGSQLILRVTPVKAAYNIAQWTLATAAGAFTLAALTSGDVRTAAHLPALIAAMAVVIAVNSVAVAVVLVLLGGWPRDLWRPLPALAAITVGAVPGLINVSWGVLLVAAHMWTPLAAPLFLLPLCLLHWLQHGSIPDLQERWFGRAFNHAMAALSSAPSPMPSLPVFLREVRRATGSDVVELVIFRGRLLEIHRCGGAGGSPYTATAVTTGEQHPASVLLHQPPPQEGCWIRLDDAAPQMVAVLQHLGRPECFVAGVRAGEGRSYGVLLAYDQLRPVRDPARVAASLAALGRELALAFERSSLLDIVSEEQSKLAQIFNDTNDGIATVDADGLVHNWNPAFEAITGYPASRIVGTVGLEQVRAADEHGTPVSLAGWSAASAPLPQTLRIRTAAGVESWLNCTYARTVDRSDPDHPAERLIVMARNVTELRRAQRLLAAETEVLRLVAQSAPIERSLGVLAEALAGSGSGLGCAVFMLPDSPERQLRLVASSGVASEVVDAMERGTPPACGNVAVRAVAGEGEVRVPALSRDERYAQHAQQWLRYEIAGCWSVAIEAAGGQGAMGSVVLFAADPFALTDDSHGDMLRRAAHVAAIAVERSRAEHLLAVQARHDPLTGLVNRTVFLDRTTLALNRARRGGAVLAVIFIDLDRFKMVNDSLGHEAGDQMLIGVARRLSAALRPGDTVARFGGDEFTVLCEGLTDEEQVVEVARRVDAVLGEPIIVGHAELYATASIGVAVSTGEETAESLIGNADAAMYRAKQRGGHGVELFDAAMRRRASERLDTQTAMHRALERSEFEVFYQPTVDLATGVVNGVEALVRWRHPTRGLLAPVDFLDLAENSGLIVPIGLQVLRQACDQAFAWRTAGPGGTPLRMSINLSARQFSQPNLPSLVEEVLADSRVEPSSICFEITESAVMDDALSTVAAMDHLKALGVRLSIDDFGTGYSSFTYLKRFPVDELKVDRSFVTGLLEDGEDSAIVAAVINLAHSLNLNTVAEGVELSSQVDRLRTLGCDSAQGYYFGRPLPAQSLRAPEPRLAS